LTTKGGSWRIRGIRNRLGYYSSGMKVQQSRFVSGIG
jgi:hypothetical protein